MNHVNLAYDMKRRKIVSLGILILVAIVILPIVVYLIWSGVLLLIAMVEHNPFGARCDAGSSAIAWLDSNENGVRDPREPPLEGVCIISSISDHFEKGLCDNLPARYLTDPEGIWNGGEFYPGTSCEGVRIQAYAPEGFYPTTRTQIRDCFAEFGFAPVKSNP